MFSSALFFLAAKIVFFLRAFSALLQKDERSVQKKRLLSNLKGLKAQSFGGMAKSAVELADRILNSIAGNRIGSLTYFFRLTAIGCGLGLSLSFFALIFVSENFEQAARIFSNKPWQQFVLFPSLIVGSLLCPFDVIFAHLLVRWAVIGGRRRAFFALISALPLGYLIWSVGAGLGAAIGLYFAADFFKFSFVLNRIWVAFLGPITSSANLGIGLHSFSYGLLSASSVLSTLLVSVIFSFSVVLRSVSPRVLEALTTPIFAILTLIDWLEKKGVNYPVKLLAWCGAGLLVLCAVLLRLIGA